MRSVKLKEFSVSDGGSVNPAKHKDEIFDLYSISAYDTYKPEILPGAAIGSAKKVVQTNDVLISRIVPHIRRVWVVGPNNGRRQIASGEWIIYRGDSFDPNYLRHILMADHFHQQFMKTVSGIGGSLLRARPSEVEKVKIPLPPLLEQKRIASILNKADAIRRKRQAAIKLADDFLRATFLDMFGDPITNPKGWMVEPLGEHCEEMRYGSSVKCSAIKTENSLPVLRIPNVAKEKVNFEDIVYSSLPKQERTKLKLINGDLLFVRTNGNPDYIGRCAVYKNDTDMLYASYLIRVRLNKDKLLPEYVQACISSKSYRKIIIKEAKTTAGNYNINTQGLRGLKIPMASLWKQKKYLEINNIVEKQITKKYLGVEYSETLFNSLTQRAFRGEL